MDFSGEALKSFLSENRLEKLMGQMRPGDYLFIQFAHNDQKTQSSAYSAPFSDYQDYLRLYIREARIRGAVPVLVTPVLRRNFNEEGQVVNTHGDYPEAMRKVAESEMVALIDLFEMSRILYETLGPEGSVKLFVHYPAGSCRSVPLLTLKPRKADDPGISSGGRIRVRLRIVSFPKTVDVEKPDGTYLSSLYTSDPARRKHPSPKSSKSGTLSRVTGCPAEGSLPVD